MEVGSGIIDFPTALLVSKNKSLTPLFMRVIEGNFKNRITSGKRQVIYMLQTLLRDNRNMISGLSGP